MLVPEKEGEAFHLVPIFLCFLCHWPYKCKDIYVRIAAILELWCFACFLLFFPIFLKFFLIIDCLLYYSIEILLHLFQSFLFVVVYLSIVFKISKINHLLFHNSAGAFTSGHSGQYCGIWHRPAEQSLPQCCPYFRLYRACPPVEGTARLRMVL